MEVVTIPPGRILEIRNEQGISIFEARRIALRESMLAAIDRADGMDDIKIILRTIVENWEMKQ
jgi:hypothetical protein